MYIHLIMGRIPNLVMKRQYTGTKLSCFMTFCSWFLSFFFEPDLILHYPRPFSTKYTNSQAPHPCPKMSLTIDLKKIMKVHVTAAWNWYLQGTAIGRNITSPHLEGHSRSDAAWRMVEGGEKRYYGRLSRHLFVLPDLRTVWSVWGAARSLMPDTRSNSIHHFTPPWSGSKRFRGSCRGGWGVRGERSPPTVDQEGVQHPI